MLNEAFMGLYSVIHVNEKVGDSTALHKMLSISIAQEKLNQLLS